MCRTGIPPYATWVALLPFVCPVTALAAAIDWVPDDLSPGDKYHLAYVTSGTFQATQTGIAWYNLQVDNAMVGIDSGSPWGGITWKCIGSAYDDGDAKDNIGYASSSAPVYRLDGSRIADNSSALWSAQTSPLLACIDVDELGNESILAGVWTGTTILGTKADYALGTSTPVFGVSNRLNGYWLNYNYTGRTWATRLYGFSEELTLPGGGGGVPEPSTVVLSLMGLAAGAALRRRRRRSSK